MVWNLYGNHRHSMCSFTQWNDHILLFLFTFLKNIIKFITISQCTRLYFVNVINAYDRNESFFFVYCNLGPISSLHLRAFNTLSSFFVFRLFVVFFFYDFFFVYLFSWFFFALFLIKSLFHGFYNVWIVVPFFIIKIKEMTIRLFQKKITI